MILVLDLEVLILLYFPGKSRLLGVYNIIEQCTFSVLASFILFILVHNFTLENC